MTIAKRERTGAPSWPSELDNIKEGLSSSRRGLVLAPLSIGELFDKITILEIKSERINDSAKRINVTSELRLLGEVRDRAVVRSPMLDRLATELKRVNESLWEIEDDIRDCERRGEFGAQFVTLARSVYRTNDLRTELKRRINELSGSLLVEEKSYKEY